MASTNKDPAKSKVKKTSKKKALTESKLTPGQSTNTITTSAKEAQTSPAVNAPLTNEAEQKRLAEMVMLANLEYNKLKNKVVREKRREMDSLDTQIKEFLGSYMLIGYDLNNNPVEIISASNTAENDALLERFRRVMFKINQNISNSNGDDPFGNNS